jgi:hypothetical protein
MTAFFRVPWAHCDCVPKDLERLAQDSIWVKSFDDADGVEGTHRIGVGAVAIMMRSMHF